MTRKELEVVLSQKPQLLRAVLEARNERCIKKVIGYSKGHISDPTATKAIRNMTEIKRVVIYYGPDCIPLKVYRPERWLALINFMETWGNDRQRALWNRRYTQGIKEVGGYCKEWKVSRSEYYNIRQELLVKVERLVKKNNMA